jgi:hypothetical protein
MLQLACGALRCSRSSSAWYSSMTPCSVPLSVLCSSFASVGSGYCLFSLCCVLVLYFSGSDFEVMNGHSVEKKEVNEK